MESSRTELAAITPRYSRWSSVSSSSWRISVKPLIDVSGVRSSCETRLMNSSLIFCAASSSSIVARSSSDWPRSSSVCSSTRRTARARPVTSTNPSSPSRTLTEPPPNRTARAFPWENTPAPRVAAENVRTVQPL